ncbi:MAG TPA: GMC family oxidoreductase N-terminal domain-containing protein [Longimicrobiales bacterium]
MRFPTRRTRAALDALCRRIVPAAYESEPPVDVCVHVEQRICGLDAAMRRDVIGALHFFDHPITGMLLSGRPRRFSTLPPSEQDAMLREWERSSLGLRRTVFQALRRLILSTYYAMPESHPGIGYLPPLYSREPAFAWEGPAPDVPEDGPVQSSTAAPSSGRRAPPRTRVSHSSAAPPCGIIAGAELAGTATFDADVCIVGSGAGGAVMAARLAEAGFAVIVLEEGGYFAGADFDDDESRLAPLLYADGAARATDDLSIVLLQGRSVGGGTTVNWMMTLRPQPWVMREWEHEHGVELLSERRLAPALAGVEHAIHARPVPYSAQSPINRCILDGCAALGWRTLEARINAQGCVRAGSCGIGCRWGAKRSAGEVFIPRALEAGARVFCDARADHIEQVERGGRAPLKRVRATVLDRVSREPRACLTIEAPVVVLAGGAVGTPVLLERSGLGGGGVGRWLRLHPTTAVFGRYSTPMYPAAGIPQSAVCSEFLESNDGYGFWIEAPSLRPGLVAAALPGFGAEHRTYMQDFGHLGPLILLVRDGADRGRSAGNVRVDRNGRVRIRYRLANADRSTLVRAVQAGARLALRTGAREVVTLHAGGGAVRSERDVDALATRSYGPNRVALFSAHVNGTCRMGADARESGCTPEGERHGVPGLYVADGSLFPTSPGVNPQTTIMALSSLIADGIVDRHRSVC